MNLHGLRKDRKLTLKDLADYMNVSTQTIMNWENNIYEPDINNLVKLADFFDVSIDYLVGRYIYDSTIDKIKCMDKDELIELLKKILDLMHQE